MRVALVNNHFSLQGSHDRLCVLLAQSLVKLGIDTHVYCNPETRSVDVPGVTFHDVGSLFTHAGGRVSQPLHIGSFSAHATRAVRRDRTSYDLVHVSGCSAWEHDVVTVHSVTKAEQLRWPERAGRTYKAARARAALAPVLWPRTGLLRWVQARQLRRQSFARLIVPTNEVLRDLERLYRIPPALIDVIPYPITVERWATPDTPEDLRQSLGIPSESPLLLFIGHDFERKGLSEAVEALHGLRPSAHLIVIGAGDPSPFTAIGDRLGVADRLHFAGPTTDPARYYQGADLLVHPSREDVWGIAPVEAMAFGLPVVSSEVTGSAGEVRSAGAGVVLADTTPDSLRRTISELLLDPERRRLMGERGYAASSRFHSDVIAEQTIAVYERVLHDRLVGRPER
jgi:glycosyltransferase involved in cell wall biosynthesis